MPFLRSGKWYTETKQGGAPILKKKKGRSTGTLVNKIRKRIARKNLDKVKKNLKFEMGDFNFESFDRKVPSFGGEIKELSRFVACCDAFHTTLSQEGKRELGSNLIFKVKGPAFTMIDNMTPNNRTWEIIKPRIIEKFGKQRSMAMSQKDLIELRQGAGESVRDFAQRIEDCVTEMNRASTEIKVENVAAVTHFKLWHDKLALRAFHDGLRAPLRWLIKARNYETLEEAVRGALEEEAYSSTEDSRMLSKSTGGVTPTRTGRTTVICMKCKERGHYANQCNEFQQFNRFLDAKQINWGPTNTRRYENYHVSDQSFGYPRLGNRNGYIPNTDIPRPQGFSRHWLPNNTQINNSSTQNHNNNNGRPNTNEQYGRNYERGNDARQPNQVNNFQSNRSRGISNYQQTANHNTWRNYSNNNQERGNRWENNRGTQSNQAGRRILVNYASKWDAGNQQKISNQTNKETGYEPDDFDRDWRKRCFKAGPTEERSYFSDTYGWIDPTTRDGEYISDLQEQAARIAKCIKEYENSRRHIEYEDMPNSGGPNWKPPNPQYAGYEDYDRKYKEEHGVAVDQKRIDREREAASKNEEGLTTELMSLSLE